MQTEHIDIDMNANRKQVWINTPAGTIVVGLDNDGQTVINFGDCDAGAIDLERAGYRINLAPVAEVL